MDIVQKLKKLNLKQPKYVFPLIVLLPLLFLGYTVALTARRALSPILST